MIAPQETASGGQRAWTLLEKLGEGDAGEVFRVESILDRRTAILKRPRKNGFASDAIRQSTQIDKEAQVLAILAHGDATGRLVHTPTLLDRSKPGSEFSDRFFIVMTAAPGLCLGYLARVARFGAASPLQPGDPQPEALSPSERLFVENLAAQQRLPDLLLLRLLSGLLDYLEVVHTMQAEISTGRAYGVLWNDVKVEHIFWDPSQSRITLIDWGNAQFLESDGSSPDRLHSRMTDYQQILDELGGFLAEANAELYSRLEWPAGVPASGIYTDGIQPLRLRLAGLLEAESAALASARQAETAILLDTSAGLEQFEKLTELQHRVIAAGENPDYANAERFFFQLGHTMVSSGRIAEVAGLFKQAECFPFLETKTCRLLGRMAAEAAAGAIPPSVLLSALANDWQTALWDLRRASLFNHNPRKTVETQNIASLRWEDWYEEFLSRLHAHSLPRPLVALNRVMHTLQSAVQATPTDAPTAALLQKLKDEVHPRWSQLEPDPPNSGIDYHEVETILENILSLQPEAGGLLLRALEQPRLQAGIVLSAWEQRDFDTARRALRQMLVWDPDRCRLFQAENALADAPAFLAEVAGGLTGDDPLADFITRQELHARELRNQVGSAAWLDSLLDAFKQLRKGAEPTDVLVNHPEVRDVLSWLVALEPRRPLLASPDHPILLEQLPLPEPSRPLLLGVKESQLGSPDGIQLTESLDTWVAEARGSSARLFLGEVTDFTGERRHAAMKLMRPDRREYALPLFSEEVRILTLLRDVPGVVPMLECGFIKLDNQALPPEERNAWARDLTGQLHRFGPDSVHNFLSDLEKRTGEGWIPYLALEKMERPDNLLLLCDSGHTRGRFMPILEGLVIAQQICDILEVAHTRDIVYRDHKILHYYWQSAYNGLFMIDWNVAKRCTGGLSPAEVQFDLVQFGAHALHVILTGRPAPGALPMGPNRPEEIEAAQHSYTASWTYDDQRLPKDIKDLLEAILSGSYDSARSLKEDIHTIYKKLFELV